MNLPSLPDMILAIRRLVPCVLFWIDTMRR